MWKPDTNFKPYVVDTPGYLWGSRICSMIHAKCDDCYFWGQWYEESVDSTVPVTNFLPINTSSCSRKCMACMECLDKEDRKNAVNNTHRLFHSYSFDLYTQLPSLPVYTFHPDMEVVSRCQSTDDTPEGIRRALRIIEMFTCEHNTAELCDTSQERGIRLFDNNYVLLYTMLDVHSASLFSREERISVVKYLLRWSYPEATLLDPVHIQRFEEMCFREEVAEICTKHYMYAMKGDPFWMVHSVSKNSLVLDFDGYLDVFSEEYLLRAYYMIKDLFNVDLMHPSEPYTITAITSRETKTERNIPLPEIQTKLRIYRCKFIFRKE